MEATTLNPRNWHMHRTETALTLSRRLPVRWDLAVQAHVPKVRMGRLAHQIRQDMWRSLRDIRGFCPAVRVEEDGPHLRIIAGGRVEARPFPKAKAETQLAELLANPAHVRRWLANARPEVRNV